MKRLKFLVIFVFPPAVLLAGILYLSLVRSQYHYDVKTDYTYTFDAKTLKKASVKINHESFLLPKQNEEWDTGFLKIRLKSTLAGHVFEPYLDICSGDDCFRHYFERGVEGMRYINISPLARHLPAQAVLRPHHLSCEPQDGQLYLFRNPGVHDKRILIVAPHPDDAEIAAFGLYSHKDSRVVTITDGGAGPDVYEKFFSGPDKKGSYALKARLRVIDSITVPVIGGINSQKCINLGYFDGTLQTMHDHPVEEVSSLFSQETETAPARKHNVWCIPNTDCKATWRNLVRDLVFLLKEVRPDIIVVPHPAMDSHPDHKYAAMAVFEALGKIKPAPKGDLFLYTNHHPLSIYYPFGEKGSMITLPPFFTDAYTFKGTYSYGLAKETQVEKLFALDAMHALRKPPENAENERAVSLGNLVHFAKNYVRDSIGLDASYFRRAVRSNELFFIYPYDDASRLITDSERFSVNGVE